MLQLKTEVSRRLIKCPVIGWLESFLRTEILNLLYWTCMVSTEVTCSSFYPSLMWIVFCFELKWWEELLEIGEVISFFGSIGSRAGTGRGMASQSIHYRCWSLASKLAKRMVWRPRVNLQEHWETFWLSQDMTFGFHHILQYFHTWHIPSFLEFCFYGYRVSSLDQNLRILISISTTFAWKYSSHIIKLCSNLLIHKTFPDS